MKMQRSSLFLSRFATLQAMALLLCAACSPAGAQDVLKRLEVDNLYGKKIYDNVKVVGPTDQGLKIIHDGGISLVPFNKLPEEWKAKYSPVPGDSAPAVSSGPAVSPSMTRIAGDSAATAAQGFDPGCLVFIQTDSSNGSGFVVKVDERYYVYTNAHVLCGKPGSFTKKIVSIKTAAGTSLPIPYELELSNMSGETQKGLEDMARFPVVFKEGHPSYSLGELDIANAMGEKVTAYGNSLGGSVMTSLDGAVVGLGTDRIEISCEIVPGNSGGPVVLKNTRQVVGVSTYATSGERDIWVADTRFSGIRRFAMRPEKVTKWRKMLYTSLMTSLAELEAFDRDTLSLAAACHLEPRPNRGGFDAPDRRNWNYVIRQVLVDGSKHTLGSSIAAGISRVNQRLGGARGVMAVNDVVPEFANFFSSVAAASTSQTSSLGTADRAPYIKQFIPELIRIRTKIHAEFVQLGTLYR